MKKQDNQNKSIWDCAKNWVKFVFPVLAIFIELFAMVSMVRHLFNRTENLAVGIILDILMMFAGIAILQLGKNFDSGDSDEEYEKYSDKIRTALVIERKKNIFASVQEESKQEIDALGLMRINLEEIKQYYTWSKKQAKSSFYLALGMCIAGLVLIAVTIFKPIDANTSIITAVGGVITELIAGTALVVYKYALQQLNYYHKSLHEDARFLSSINLLEKLSTPEARDSMLQEVIRSEIQMNVSEFSKGNGSQEEESAKKSK